MIENARLSLVTQKAIAAAQAAGDDPATEFDIYKSYMQPVPPIDIMPTTGPGLIQHINDIGDLPISAGFMYSGEVSDELAYNQDMMENIKTLSEIYDTGDKEVKYTKGVEYRSKAINGQPVSALFVGSPGHILYDEATKKKFNIAFMSKLARRSWFCYTPETIPEPDFMDQPNPIQALWDYEERVEAEAKQARAAMNDTICSITRFGLDTAGTHLSVTEDVFRLFKTYKRYNSDLADATPSQSSTSALIRRHLQWKAIKLAGALALFDKCDEIRQHHYIDAIRFCELLSADMELFEHDLNKSDHERFSDFISKEAQIDGKTIISIHDIKKRGFIASASKHKLEELITLCTAYDETSIYSLVNDNTAIQYEPIIKTDVLNVSYKPIRTVALNNAVASKDHDAVQSAKQDIAKSTAYGFESGETSFEDLGRLLASDYAYSPFRFKNGVRGKDNILHGTKWIVFDVDNSTISASEAHFMLADINHHIALGSDPNNDMKFHVLIELDSVVDLDPLPWKHFYTAVADSLALNVDLLPQSQIFFSYADRPILSVTDGQPLEIRAHVITAKERIANTTVDKKLSPAQQTAKLSDPLGTFDYCFECPLDGAGSRSMIRMVYEAKKELHASHEQVVDLLHQVQDYWEVPMPQERFDNILKQVARMYQG